MHAFPNTSPIPIIQLLLTFTVDLTAENSLQFTQFKTNSLRVLPSRKITVAQTSKRIWLVIQGVSGGIVNILVGSSMDYSG
jgi:hypothetical protein